MPPGLLRGLLGVEPAQLPLLHLLHLCRGAGGALPLLTGALHHDWPEVERGIAGLVAEVEGRGVRLLTGQMVTAVEQVLGQETLHEKSWLEDALSTICCPG